MKKVSQTGWVILHPEGRMELDYFDSALDYDKEWMAKYRPKCTLHKVEITVSNETLFKAVAV